MPLCTIVTIILGFIMPLLLSTTELNFVSATVRVISEVPTTAKYYRPFYYYPGGDCDTSGDQDQLCQSTNQGEREIGDLTDTCDPFDRVTFSSPNFSSSTPYARFRGDGICPKDTRQVGLVYAYTCPAQGVNGGLYTRAASSFTGNDSDVEISYTTVDSDWCEKNDEPPTTASFASVRLPWSASIAFYDENEQLCNNVSANFNEDVGDAPKIFTVVSSPPPSTTGKKPYTGKNLTAGCTSSPLKSLVVTRQFGPTDTAGPGSFVRCNISFSSAVPHLFTADIVSNVDYPGQFCTAVSYRFLSSKHATVLNECDCYQKMSARQICINTGLFWCVTRYGTEKCVGSQSDCGNACYDPDYAVPSFSGVYGCSTVILIITGVWTLLCAAVDKYCSGNNNNGDEEDGGGGEAGGSCSIFQDKTGVRAIATCVLNVVTTIWTIVVIGMGVHLALTACPDGTCKTLPPCGAVDASLTPASGCSSHDLDNNCCPNHLNSQDASDLSPVFIIGLIAFIPVLLLCNYVQYLADSRTLHSSALGGGFIRNEASEYDRLEYVLPVVFMLLKWGTSYLVVYPAEMNVEERCIYGYLDIQLYSVAIQGIGYAVAFCFIFFGGWFLAQMCDCRCPEGEGQCFGYIVGFMGFVAIVTILASLGLKMYDFVFVAKIEFHALLRVLKSSSLSGLLPAASRAMHISVRSVVHVFHKITHLCCCSGGVGGASVATKYELQQA